MVKTYIRVFFVVLACFVLIPRNVSATESKTYSSLITPLLTATTDILGQPLTYPSGKPKISVVIVELSPGQETGWHTHSVPLFIRVLEGSIEVDYGSKGIKTYSEGDIAIEALNWPHNGKNKTGKPVKILAVYFGEDGVPNAEVSEASK